MDICSIDFKDEIIVGKALKIGERTFHPIIKFSTLKNEKGNLLGTWTDILAIVVAEGEKEYIFPFTEEEIDYDELFNL